MAVTVTFLVRLLPDRLQQGEVVGEVLRVGDDGPVRFKDLAGLYTALVAAAPESDLAVRREGEARA